MLIKSVLYWIFDPNKKMKTMYEEFGSYPGEITFPT